MCVRVHVVVLMRAGVEVTGEAVQDADEAVPMQGYSKTDPNGQGSVVNLHAAKGRTSCFEGLLKKHRVQSGRCRHRVHIDEESDEFKFSADSGSSYGDDSDGDDSERSTIRDSGCYSPVTCSPLSVTKGRSATFYGG